MWISEVLQIACLVLGMSAVAFFAYKLVMVVMPDPALLAAQQRLGVELAQRPYRHRFLAMVAPIVQVITPRIQQLKMPGYRQEQKKKFIMAAVDDQFDADEFVSLKLISAALTMIGAQLFLMQAGFSISPLSILLFSVVGFYLPDYVVWDLKRQRQKAILAILPGMMDLLTLSVEAGLDFMAAISRVVEFSKDGPMKQELSQMLKELQLGTVRAQALRNMADRCGVSELSSFATILIQADQMGASIGPVLRAQADQLRASRFQRAEREGAKATQKLLLPLVVFILPSVFIVILGPLICDIVYNQTWFTEIFGGK